MSAPETQNDSGPVPTTGHEWDGIRELDNPLPRWWLWIFYASVVYAIGYWILMPAWPGLTGYTRGVLGKSDRAAVVEQLSELKTLRGQQNARLTQASLQEIESDPKLQAHALAVGQSAFGDNCATCHGVPCQGARRMRRRSRGRRRSMRPTASPATGLKAGAIPSRARPT